jgi:hypothetical protein
MKSFKPHPSFEFINELLPDEVAKLKEYKTAPSGLAYQLNAILRGRQVERPPDPVSIRWLDSAIRKSRAVDAIKLFRATFVEDFDSFVRDGIFYDPAYASTTLNESRLVGHYVSGYSKRPIKLLIECPKHANALHLELVDDNGETESECLLPRCGRYRIVSEHPQITKTKAIAQAMGHNNWYHAKDFEALRIVELSLIP